MRIFAITEERSFASEQVNNPQAAGLIGEIVNHSSNLPVANKAIRRFDVCPVLQCPRFRNASRASLVPHTERCISLYRCRFEPRIVKQVAWSES